MDLAYLADEAVQHCTSAGAIRNFGREPNESVVCRESSLDNPPFVCWVGVKMTHQHERVWQLLW